MSLMMSSCCTFRLKRRSALSIDSPSCNLTSAKSVATPLPPEIRSSLTFETPNGVSYVMLGNRGF